MAAAKKAKPAQGKAKPKAKPVGKMTAKPAGKAKAKAAVKVVAKVAPKKSVPVKKAAPQAGKVVPKKGEKKSASAGTAPVRLVRSIPVPSFAASFGAGNKLPPRVQALIDQKEIETTVFNLARGIDRVDETMVRAVFHADASLDYGPGIFQGPVAEYIPWLMSFLQQVKSSHHMIGNLRADVRGDDAFAESYVTAHHRLEKPTGREDLFLAGRYLDRFERRPSGPAGAWKIVHRKFVLDWVRTEPVSDIFYHLNPDALWGQRGKADMSYQMENFPGGQSGAGQAGKMPAFLNRRYEGKSIKL